MIRTPRLSFIISAGLLALAIASSAQESFKAVHSAIIEANGPKAGDNAARYFNVEGKDKNKYACYGILQFDSAAIKSALDKKFGSGKYAVTGLSLDLCQSNAAFSAPGAVNIYYLAGKVDVSKLKYPFDPAGALKGTAVSGLKYSIADKPTKKAAGSPKDQREMPIDVVNLMKSTQGADLPKKLFAGSLFSLALVEAQSGVAATWAGQSNTHLTPPTLVVTAVKK